MATSDTPPLTDEKRERLVREALQSSTTGRVRHCANHAFHHLERAAQLVDIDPEMAMLRAITAEEEAATAVFLSLKQRRYPNAELLQLRSHPHKLGLYIFVSEVRNFFASVSHQFPPMRLLLKEVEGGSRLIWQLLAPDGRWAEPDTPFNFLVSDASPSQPYHFERQLEELANRIADGDIKDYIVTTANTRNLLLYADDDGLPAVVGGVDETLKAQRERVVTLCMVACMIAPYKERALFVMQALNAFLSMMGKIDKEALAEISYKAEIRSHE